MKCRGRRGTIDRDDVDTGEHLVEAVPIGRLQLVLGRRIDALAVVIVDRQAKGLGAACNGGADTAHADDADALAPDSASEHPGRRPAFPFARLVHQDARALHQTARDGEDQCHRHVGRIFRQDIRRIGDGDAFFRGASMSMWSVPLEKLAISFSCAPASAISAASIRSVTVGTRTSADFTSLDQFFARAWPVVDVEFGLEEFAHARFHGIGQLPRDIDLGSLPVGHGRIDAFFRTR